MSGDREKAYVEGFLCSATSVTETREETEVVESDID
jgi:hypothetical protein